MVLGNKQLGGVATSKVVVLLLTIVIQVFLAWELGPGGMGAYAICLMFSSLLSIIFVIGCDVAITYHVSSKYFDISEGVSYTLLYGGTGSAIAILIGVFLINIEIEVLQKVEKVELYISLASIPITLFATIFLQLFTAIHDFNTYSKLSIVQGLVLLISTIILVNYISLGLKGALIAVVFSSLISIIISLFYLKKSHDYKLCALESEKIKKLFKYGMRYYFGRLSNTANTQIGTLILAILMPKESVGIFSIGLQFVTRIMIIPDTLFVLLAPKSAAAKTGRKRLVARSARLTALICSILLLILFFIAEPLITILYSELFIESAHLIQILCIGVLVRCISKIYVPYFLGVNRPGIASLSVFFGVLINLTLYMILVPKYGLTGAAISTIIGYMLSSSLLLAFFKHYSKLSIKEIVFFKRSDFSKLQ